MALSWNVLPVPDGPEISMWPLIAPLLSQNTG